MWKFFLGLTVFLGLAGAGQAQKVSLPAEVKGEVGDFVKVPAAADGKEVRWYSPDKELRLFPMELLRDTRTAVVLSFKPGRYRLVAWTAVADVPSVHAECVVQIGEAPGPGPGPGPDPAPPPPPDPLAKSILGAWAKETAPDRLAKVAELAKLYRLVGNNLPAVATNGELYATMRLAASKLLAFEDLKHVRTALAGELDRVLGTDPASLVNQSLARATFSSIATVLEGLK